MDDEDRQDRSPLSPNRKCESFWTLTEGDTVLIGDEQDEMERLLWTRNCGTDDERRFLGHRLDESLAQRAAIRSAALGMRARDGAF